MKHTPLSKVYSFSVASLLVFGLVGPLYPSGVQAAGSTSPGPIVISEILANAINESTGELVEIVNTGSAAVDLTGFKFMDASLVQQTLAPFAKALPFGVAGLTLQPQQAGLILDKDYASEYDTEILQSDASDSILLLTTSTGNLNLANSADSAAIIGSDSVTRDSFAWSSDPGSEVTFARLMGTTGLASLAASDHRTLGWLEHEAPPAPAPTLSITELLPGPTTGEEFIELYNAGSADVDLSSVSARDASQKTTVLSGTLGSKKYAAFYKSTTGISLNNDGDTIELLWKSATETKTLDTVAYETAPSDQSWASLAGKFDWTIEPTPGEPNLLVKPPVNEPGSTEDPTDPTDPDAPDETIDDPLEEESTTIDTLADLASQDDGTIVSIAGTVSAKTNTFYKNTLHIADGSGSALIKVDSDIKATIGDTIQVTGELETYAQQKRILADTLEVVGKSAVPYIEVSPGHITEGQVGRPVRLSGVVARRSGKSFRIAAKNAKSSDDDTLVSIRKSTGITTSAPKKGSAVTIAGIVLHSGDQLVVAPRNAADLSGGKAGSTLKATSLNKSGASTGELILWAGLAALALTIALHVARPAARRAARLGRSKSSPSLVGQ